MKTLSAIRAALLALTALAGLSSAASADEGFVSLTIYKAGWIIGGSGGGGVLNFRGRSYALSDLAFPPGYSETKIALRDDFIADGGRPFEGLILIDPAVADTRRRRPQDIHVWREHTLKSVGESPGLLAQVRREVGRRVGHRAPPVRAQHRLAVPVRVRRLPAVRRHACGR